MLEMIREFDQEELWRPYGVCSCAHWLNWKCGIGMNAAREKARVANALGALPKISVSFSRGEISYSKARAMTRAATPDNEDYLLMIAEHGTTYHVETLVRKPNHCLMRYLLDKGASINFRDAMGMTPLHYAVLACCGV